MRIAYVDGMDAMSSRQTDLIGRSGLGLAELVSLSASRMVGDPAEMTETEHVLRGLRLLGYRYGLDLEVAMDATDEEGAA